MSRPIEPKRKGRPVLPAPAPDDFAVDQAALQALGPRCLPAIGRAVVAWADPPDAGAPFAWGVLASVGFGRPIWVGEPPDWAGGDFDEDDGDEDDGDEDDGTFLPETDPDGVAPDEPRHDHGGRDSLEGFRPEPQVWSAGMGVLARVPDMLFRSPEGLVWGVVEIQADLLLAWDFEAGAGEGDGVGGDEDEDEDDDLD